MPAAGGDPPSESRPTGVTVDLPKEVHERRMHLISEIACLQAATLLRKGQSGALLSKCVGQAVSQLVSHSSGQEQRRDTQHHSPS